MNKSENLYNFLSDVSPGLLGSLSTIKIKLNTNNGWDEPLDLWKQNPSEINNNWLFWCGSKRTFYVGQIAICLVWIPDSDNEWLLTCIQKVMHEFDIWHGVKFAGSPMFQFQQTFGRTIVKYDKYHRQNAIYYTPANRDQMQVCQYLPSIYK